MIERTAPPALPAAKECPRRSAPLRNAPGAPRRPQFWGREGLSSGSLARTTTPPPALKRRPLLVKEGALSLGVLLKLIPSSELGSVG